MGIIIDPHLTDKEIESWTYPRHKHMSKQATQTTPGRTKKRYLLLFLTAVDSLQAPNSWVVGKQQL